MSARPLQPLLIGGLALCGLVVAGLWLTTAWRAWPGVVLESAVNHKETVSQRTTMAVWQRSEGLENAPLPGPHVHFPGLAGYKLVQDTSLPVFRRAEILIQAERATRQALLREPAEARAWARLAWFLHIRQAEASQPLAALRMSLYLAPADKDLVFWRIKMASSYRAAWDADFEQLLTRQVILGWRISPARLAKTAKAAKLQEWVRSVLSSDSEELERFDALVRKS